MILPFIFELTLLQRPHVPCVPSQTNHAFENILDTNADPESSGRRLGSDRNLSAIGKLTKPKIESISCIWRYVNEPMKMFINKETIVRVYRKRYISTENASWDAMAARRQREKNLDR